MKGQVRLSSVICLLLMCILNACGEARVNKPADNTDPNNGNPQNIPPEVLIRPTQSVDEQTELTLYSTATDSDGQITEYLWIQTQGPTLTLSDPSQTSISFVTPATATPITIGFQLTVTDNLGAESTEEVQVTVNPVNIAPVASAGQDQTVEEITEVILKGAAHDDDGSIVSYLWTQLSGTPIQITDADKVTARFVAPATLTGTTLTFKFEVIDNEQATDSDQVEIFVRHINQAPQLTSLEVENNSSGDIPVIATHTDVEHDEVILNIELSLNNGLSWQPASLINELTNEIVASSTGRTIIYWDSIHDLGFRQPKSVQLRATPRDYQLSGNTYLTTTHTIDNLRAAADKVNHYAVYYGKVTNEAIANLETYQLVILHPSPDIPDSLLTRAEVSAIQDGVNSEDLTDDVLVLCYVSIGEDLRTVNLTDQQLATDPRFIGDPGGVRGPRIDPRGIEAYNNALPLTDIDELGAPSPAGTNFASWFLDDVSMSQNQADGLPDRNSVYGGAYVNIGDPAWFNVLNNMLSTNGDPHGIQEILTTTVGQGLGCDGLLLDTIDTTAPNTFSDTAKFEWTAPGVKRFMQRLRNEYPRALLLQNRGLFFFNPQFEHYTYRTTNEIDILLFESYRLDANSTADFNSDYFCENKRVYAPKIKAEADRPGGFKLLSLGYAEGPADPVSGDSLVDTLVGNSSFGLETLLADISETQDLIGFRHYISNHNIDLLNNFVRQNANINDNLPPLWSSTYNDQPCTNPDSELLPSPRTGIQEILSQKNSVTVRWDVAFDKHSVNYIVYYQDQPFNFDATDPLANAIKLKLNPGVSSNYLQGSGPNVFANEDRIEDLKSGTRYYFLIRAIDQSPEQNEDTNQIVLSTTPD